MKKLNLYFSIVLVFIFFNAIVYAQELPTLAIMDVVAKEGVTEDETMYLTHLVFDGAYKHGKNKYMIIDKESRDKLLKEHQFAFTNSCYSKECVIEAGNYLSSDYMIAGTLEKYKKGFIPKKQYYDLSLQKINIILEETEMTIQTNDIAAPYAPYIEKSLSWKMKAFFTTPEQRMECQKKAKKAQNTTALIGAPLLLGGTVILILGLIEGLDAFSTTMAASYVTVPLTGEIYEEKSDASLYLSIGLVSALVGCCFFGISAANKEKADFWASTLE